MKTFKNVHLKSWHRFKPDEMLVYIPSQGKRNKKYEILRLNGHQVVSGSRKARKILSHFLHVDYFYEIDDSVSHVIIARKNQYHYQPTDVLDGKWIAVEMILGKDISNVYDEDRVFKKINEKEMRSRRKEFNMTFGGALLEDTIQFEFENV